jgi:hypothetical protein
VKLGGQELATLAWSAPGRQWRVPISSYGISIKERAVLRSKQTLRAKWGRCDLSVSMPEESPFRALPLEKPIITLCGHEMSGEMCVDLKTIGWVKG